MRTLPVKPLAILGIVREVKAAAENSRPILLAGAESPVRELAEALREDGDESALRELPGRAPSATDLDEASLLVYAIEGATASGHDEQVLRLASRKNVPALVVLIGPGTEDVPDLPYVLATDVIPVRAGEPLLVEEIIERIATRAGDKSYALAAKLPRIRKAVCDEIIRSFSRQNAILGAATFIPGADLPALTLNQMRMVFRIAGAYGADVDPERAVELLGVLGAGLGFRAVAREVAEVVPGLDWAVKGAIAYAGTRALGEAAIRYFEAGGIGAIARSVRSWS
jgi:uncharacterized protein (DUF697 family)